MPQFPQHPPAAKPKEAAQTMSPPPEPYTEYTPKLCGEIVDYMGLGYSLTAFAGWAGVSRETLKTWMDENPEFAAAAERGRAARTRFLEKQFLDGGPGLKVAAHVFALKNAAPEDWRDRPEAEGSKPPGAVVEVPGNGRDHPAPAPAVGTRGVPCLRGSTASGGSNRGLFQDSAHPGEWRDPDS